MKSRRYFDYYDGNKGWENTNPNWHEHTIHFTENSSQQIAAVIEWLYTRIDNCERHCRWISSLDSISVRFRHERDVILFRLTW